jgi:hypothetical protein
VPNCQTLQIESTQLDADPLNSDRCSLWLHSRW